VLEAAMGGTWIDGVSERQLVDVAKALERHGVDDPPLVLVVVDEDMKGVADLVQAL